MNDKNELNDIILNKGGSANSNKKIILAVATLGVILIIVVMLMNSLSSSGTDNLPQAALPPEPKAQVVAEDIDEPLFEEVEVIEEESNSDANLDQIAQKLKEESIQAKEEVIVVAPKPVKKVTPKKVIPKKVTPPVNKSMSGITYYIQVGSFSKYEPNKKFLKSITNLGFDYMFHNVTRNSKTLNKVLVGPFGTSKAAKDARRVLRAKVEPGAFLVKL